MKYLKQTFFCFIFITFLLAIPSLSLAFSKEDFGINHAEENYDLAKKVGFGIQRLNLIWQNLQPKPKGNFDEFTRKYLHEQIDNAKKNGLETLLLIERPPKTICGEICPEIKDLTNYEDFISKVFNEYGSKIQAIEIYNEPDREVHWPPKPNPKNYLELLKITKAKRDQISPKVKIVLGGNSGPPNKTAGYTFLYDLYDLGGKGLFDIFNYHHYSQNESPDEGWSHPDYWYSIFNSFFKENDPNLDIWVTETGYSTDGKMVSEVVTPAKQTSNLIKMYTLLFSLERIKKVFLFELLDSPSNPLSYGIYENIKTAKPAVKSLKIFLLLLKDKTFEKKITYADKFLQHYVFSNARGRFHILWLKAKYVYPTPQKINQNREVLLPFSTDKKHLIFSAVLKLVKSKIIDNKQTIPITNDPIFIYEKL